MEKKFLIFGVIAFAVLFTVSSAHADSIRLSDLKLDSATGFSNSHALEGAAVPNLFDGDFSFRSPVSGELPLFAGVVGGMDEDGISSGSDWALGSPFASHLVRRFQAGDLESKSDDSGPTSVPEPPSALLAGLGILGLFLFAISARDKPSLPPNGLQQP